MIDVHAEVGRNIKSVVANIDDSKNVSGYNDQKFRITE